MPGYLKASLKQRPALASPLLSLAILFVTLPVLRNFTEASSAPCGWAHAGLDELREFLCERVRDGSYVPLLDSGL